MTDIEFFKKEVASLLSSFNLEYRSYADGDFGALEQVVFNTQNIGGTLDFWESGWLGIYIYTIIFRVPKSATNYLNRRRTSRNTQRDCYGNICKFEAYVSHIYI